jgi:hypothetical protein
MFVIESRLEYDLTVLRAQDPRIKATALFNSGTMFGSRDSLKKLKNPLGIFNGGPNDIAYRNVSSYSTGSSNLP